MKNLLLISESITLSLLHNIWKKVPCTDRWWFVCVKWDTTCLFQHYFCQERTNLWVRMTSLSNNWVVFMLISFYEIIFWIVKLLRYTLNNYLHLINDMKGWFWQQAVKFLMLQDVERLTNSEMSIADNIIKVGYAVISADWRSADRTLATLCSTMICLSNCVVARGYW